MLISFTRQLYILIKAGIPLLKALQIIFDQLPAGRFKQNIEAIIGDIQEGKSFSESISFTPQFFSLFYINMIKAAEVSGNLTGILKELSGHLLKQRRITRQVQAAIMYPILVLIIAVVILTLLLMFVIPVFTRIFEGLGGTLPALTLFLIRISKFVAHWGGLFFALCITLTITISLLYKKTTKVKFLVSNLVWNSPLFGRVIKTMEMGRFCRTLGTLLSSGVTLMKGLEVLIETTPAVLLCQALQDIRDKIEQGSTLSNAMEGTGVFPLTLVKMIQVGEESGKTADLFLEAAEDYEDEVSFAVSGLLALLEPVLIVIMGGIVGFIVVALFFPILTMSTLVK